MAPTIIQAANNNTGTEMETGVAELKRINNNNGGNNAKSNPDALKGIRARLERARLKKIAAEERLLRQRQQRARERQAPPATPPVALATDADANGTTTTAADARPGPPANKTTASNNSSSSAKSQEAQEALDRARSKLQGALQNRERALQQHQRRHRTTNNPFPPAANNNTNNSHGNNTSTSWNRKRRFNSHRAVAQSGLPTLSALSPSFSLIIKDIPRTGPPDMIYHVRDFKKSTKTRMGGMKTRADLVELLGGEEAVEALHRGSDRYRGGGIGTKNVLDDCDSNPSDTVETTAVALSNNKKRKKPTSVSLLQRKLQLQNELMILKEKLEKKSSLEENQKQHNQKQGAAINATDNDCSNKHPMTKERLEKRKAEARTVMDISYWKHFVSKQEHLLEQVTTKINDMDNNIGNNQQKRKKGATSYQECLHKRHATNKAIANVQQDLDNLQQRHEVVEDGITCSTRNLLNARQALHEERTKESEKGKNDKTTTLQNVVPNAALARTNELDT